MFKGESWFCYQLILSLRARDLRREAISHPPLPFDSTMIVIHAGYVRGSNVSIFASFDYQSDSKEGSSCVSFSPIRFFRPFPRRHIEIAASYTVTFPSLAFITDLRAYWFQSPFPPRLIDSFFIFTCPLILHLHLHPFLCSPAALCYRCFRWIRLIGVN